VRFPTDFPQSPPRITFETAIFHPNITLDGEVCLDILKSRWAPGITMSKVILSICSLLVFPMCENAINPTVAKVLKENREAFEKKAREWTICYAYS
uniref:UBIQUITIN_CONJUGAT_2 domain-containing protein n=1 Tax=Mesocestoides corti TaxID=53468 RepID=A0A5K3EPA9_MESCO